jgi:hypothetical protein
MRHQLVQKTLKTRGVTAATQFAVPQWQLRGPTNFKGRVTAVVANPANPNTVYMPYCGSTFAPPTIAMTQAVAFGALKTAVITGHS